MTRFRYVRMDHWPPLAWLARCGRHDDTIEVHHGPRVETGETWFCEAVWDAPYAAGEFDRTDLVFGSGGRARSARVVFAASGTTLDRLQSFEAAGRAWVSNSLPCLLAAVGASVDPSYARYFEDFRSIRRGLRQHRRELATSVGPVRLTYFDNLAWDGARLSREPKAAPTRDLRSFEQYRAFLEETLARLGDNLAAPERRHPYTLVGTISSGYDSAAVAALARRAGLRDVISFDRSRGGLDDTGGQLAERLGLRLTVLRRDAWRLMHLPEVPFLAADAKGEDVHFLAAESRLAGRVLLTGFHGDEMWDRIAWPLPLNGDLARSDQCGLSLTEYRLWAGFIHCPVPFIGARQIRDVHLISGSRSMAAWDVGGPYNRPICRRILEEAGVPRDAFGVVKKNTSVLLFDRETFLSPAAHADYLRWLGAHANAWRARGRRLPRAAGAPRDPLQRAARGAARALFAIAGLAPRRLWLLRSLAWRVAGLAGKEPLFRHVFPWALEQAKQRYAAPAVDAGDATRTRAEAAWQRAGA